MMSRRQLGIMGILISVVLMLAPVSTIFGQVQSTSAEQLLEVADRAEQQVSNLINLIYANETALDAIEDIGLLEELNSNVTLYNEGVGNLVVAYDEFELKDYDSAVDYATISLGIFREVFFSIQMILETAGLKKGQLLDNQGLLEAIIRQLQRLDHLREILTEDAPEEIKLLLDNAEVLLDIDLARSLILEGKAIEVRDTLQEANGLISKVYDYLKEQAQGLNAERIIGYCERVQERIRERFRNMNQAGIDFSDVLESLGYQSENQFMATLDNIIQRAKGRSGNLQEALQDLNAIGEMVQEMEQALTQKMNQYQNGAGLGSGSDGASNGNIGGNYGQNGNSRSGSNK